MHGGCSEASLTTVLAAFGTLVSRAEAKYAALVDQIPGVVYLDPVDEATDSIFVSPQVRDLLGVEPEAWITDQYCWSKHVHPDDFVRAWDDYMYSYAHDVPMSHEYRMVHEDGTVKWVLELARPIHDEHGDPWLIQGVYARHHGTQGGRGGASRAERAPGLDHRDPARHRGDDLAVDAVMRRICERTQRAHARRRRDHPHPRRRRSRDPRRPRASWTTSR